MKTINATDFTNNIYVLLKETFEGSPPEGSQYLDRGVGVLNTIAELSAEDASRITKDNGATIAAHLEHARFYLAVLPEFMNGRTEKVDWNESWLIKKVDENEWNLLKEKVRQDYEKVAEMFQTITDWDDEKIGGAMAIVVHTAYHLGAIRQIRKFQMFQ